MKTTIRELVRAAVARRDAAYGDQFIRGRDLVDAADTLDTSGEVVVNRASLEALLFPAPLRSQEDDRVFCAHRDHLVCALKEQS